MNECDMLKGNINRIMVTDDPKDLFNNYEWACKRLSLILIERVKELLEEEEHADRHTKMRDGWSYIGEDK